MMSKRARQSVLWSAVCPAPNAPSALDAVPVSGVASNARFRLGGWAAAAVVVALLAACTTTSTTTSSVVGSNAANTAAPPPAAPSAGEQVTESDEPEVRKRARLRVELAANYFDQGQTTVALDELKQALIADPNYGPAHTLRGLVYMRLNDPKLAEEGFQRALQISPRNPDFLHNYGWFMCQQGRPKEALVVLAQALSSPLYAQQAKTLMVQGTCQLRLNQTTEAEGSFARAYELDPANPYVGYNLALLQFKREEFTKAQFVIRRLNNTDLANAETFWLGIKIERALNSPDVVRQLAQQLQRRFPQSAQWSSYQKGLFND